MVKLDNFNVDYIIPQLNEDDLKFLNLSGRKAYHSQGIYGQGEIVAVVDTGVNEHEELKGRLLKGKNFCSYRPPSDTRDDNKHGTHVAGSVAGKNIGIAPNAKILPVKVLDGSGWGEIKDITKALDWIREYKHPKDGRKVSIVSMSLSTDRRHESKEEMTEFHRAIKALVASDIAVIVSAGNTGKVQNRYPASYDEVICVGAVDVLKNKAKFSTMGNHVDVCQVGVNVISAWYQGGYAVMSGTSMSTPITSGIAALIACKHKETFNEDITEDYLWRTLKFNTKDLGIPGADCEYGTGFCTLQPVKANIWMQHDNKNLVLNGENVEMDIRAKIEGTGRFMIPARFFTEVSGTFIDFNPEHKSAKFIY